MILLTCEKVSKRFPETAVFDDVTFGIHRGDRIGVIGSNGSGKSTLLGILTGTVTPDQGQVITNDGLRVSYVAQQLDHRPGDTIGSVGQQSRKTLALLDRLGFRDADQLLSTLSGGQQRRVALAKALAVESDLLVLDEPTNHLDVDVIDWLEDQLAARSGALVVVTHDRYLLDRVSNRILEIADGRVYEHRGTYADFLEARAQRQALREATTRRQRNRARTELAWLRRSPKARTSKSKYRTERAMEMQTVGAVDEAADLEMDLPTARIGGKVINLHNAAKQYDDWVFRHFTMRMQPDARIGLVGPNGSGKTTLMEVMAGRQDPSEGKVTHGETVRVGWYGQEPSKLPPSQRVLDAVRDCTLQTRLDTGVTISASQLLERFGFASSQHSTRVDELSGGERRRLELIRVLADAPNVLFLDEPTNDLDLDTLRTLESVLDRRGGAVVVASHDRFFLDRVCHDIYSLDADGSVSHHPGGWTSYQAARNVPTPSVTSREPTATKPKTGRTGLSFNEQRELRKVSDRIPAVERQIESLRAQLNGVGDDWQEAATLGTQLEERLRERDELEHRWLELADEAES